MCRELKPGEGFNCHGAGWICLQQRRTRVVAVDMFRMVTVSISHAATIKRTGRLSSLPKEIDKLHRTIVAGRELMVSGKPAKVQSICRNGDFICQRPNSATKLRVPKWSTWWWDLVPQECVPAPSGCMRTFAETQKEIERAWRSLPPME
jgi:hypothetical protein